MKLLVIAILATACVAFLAGCVSSTATRGDASLIQSLFDKLLPADFTGPARLEHRNQYFRIVIDAGDVRRVGDSWTWSWLEYTRESSFPIFSGLTWGSSGKVRLGTPPEPRK